jgi:hypothetical protein
LVSGVNPLPIPNLDRGGLGLGDPGHLSKADARRYNGTRNAPVERLRT